MAAPCAPWHCVRGPVRKCRVTRPFNGIVREHVSSAHNAAYLSFWALAAMAPVLACGYAALALVPKWRHVSASLSLWSTVVGALFCVASYAAVALLFAGRAEIMPLTGLAVFGAVFSIGAMLRGLGLMSKRVLSNKP